MKKALVALSLIIMISTSILLVFPAAGALVTLTLPDEELSTQFTKAWGPAAVAIADVPGSGVRFDFSGLTGSGTAVSDNFPVSQFAGGVLDNIGGYGDFRGYTQYRLVLTNLGPSWISANIFINTGWTAPDPTRDTYWENNWVYIEPSKSKVVTLDFSNAICYNANDDPVLAWQYPDGTSGVAIRRLWEVSNIGLQVCGAGISSVIVSSATPTLTTTLSDAELGTQFARESGPGTVTITDIAGPGVRFDFTGLNPSSGTIVGDNFPVSQNAGGALDGTGGYGDFSIYSRYSLIFTNIGSGALTVCLKMNTGWTVPPWGSPQRDTYWQSAWTPIAAGETRTITLEFSGAIVYNALDDPNPAWQYPDGTVHPVHRLNEVSDIGFQILGSAAGSVVVTRVVDVPLTLSDAELGTQFAKETGPATLTITDIPEAGVLFQFSGLSPTTTIVSDNFAVSALACGLWKDYGSGFAGPYDFSAYTYYGLAFTNVGSASVNIKLKMNTGWTVPPWGSPQRDTYWQGPWTSIAPLETRVLTLDFWSAEARNVADDPVLAWQYPDGTSGVIVRRLDETSNIGFEIKGNGDATVKVVSFFDVLLSLSDAELGTQFARESGPGTVTITDIAGPGVKFDFTGLNPSSGTIVGDNFAVSQLAGGAYKTYGVTQQFSTWGDFSAYTKYRMIITNLGTEPVTICLKLNTGWTIPPPEYAATWRDTYWQGQWTEIAPGASNAVILDFSSARVWNAADEQEHNAYPDGTTGIAIWRLDEVSDIGFQILGDGEASIIVSVEPPIPPEPPTASFTFSPPNPKVGEVVNFDASSSTPNGGSIISYKWNFGDGNITTVSGSAITHVYGAASIYTVTLTVQDSEGLSDSASKPVTVIPAILPAYAYLKVEPETYHTSRRGTVFTINVTLNNVTTDMRLVGVEFKLQYNTTMLEPINATEGPFLKGFAGDPHMGTFFTYVIKDDYVLVGIVILPDEHGVWHFFPSGNGTLASITFEAIYQHMGKTKPPLTSSLHLFQTKVSDDTGMEPGIAHYTEDGLYEMYPTAMGDVNYDGIVDLFDIVVVALAFGSTPSSSNWNADADLNDDLIVDIFDLVVVALHYNQDP